MTKKIVRIISVKASPNFGVEVDGHINRVIHVKWRAENDELVQFVCDDQPYGSNLILPDSFNEQQLNLFKEMVQKRLDEGSLSVYGYEWPVSVVSNGETIAYIDTTKGNLLTTIRRAWPRDNDENVVLKMARMQVAKCIEKGRLKPVEL